MKKQDIIDQNDIQLLINDFYQKVNQDTLLNPFFKQVQWDKHLPLMYRFWENILFYSGDYTGNPMVQHQILHLKQHLTQEHFRRWVDLFCSTTDEYFHGPQAKKLKERAKSIGQIMEENILDSDH